MCIFLLLRIGSTFMHHKNTCCILVRRFFVFFCFACVRFKVCILHRVDFDFDHDIDIFFCG